MSEWVCIVRLEDDEDPGQVLIEALKERYGAQVRTTTVLKSTYHAQHRLTDVFQERKSFVAEHESHRLKRRYGK